MFRKACGYDRMSAQWLSLACLMGSLTCVAASQILIKSTFVRIRTATVGEVDWLASFYAALREPAAWAGGLTLIVGAVLWYVSLARLPLSLVVPAGVLVAPMSVIGAHVFLGEPLTLQMVCAIMVIAAGVIWLATQLI